jgi:hypothetical protein
MKFFLIYAAALLGVRPLPQDPLSPRPEELQGSSNSLSGIRTHRFLRSTSLLFTYRGNRNSRLRKFSVGHWVLKSPRPDMSVNADFLFPLSGLRLYRDFATRDTKPSVFQPPIPDASKRRCPRELPFQRSRLPVGTSDLACSRILTPNAQTSRCETSKVDATCTPLTPMAPRYLRNCREIASHDFAASVAKITGSNLRNPDTRSHV